MYINKKVRSLILISIVFNQILYNAHNENTLKKLTNNDKKLHNNEVFIIISDDEEESKIINKKKLTKIKEKLLCSKKIF